MEKFIMQHSHPKNEKLKNLDHHFFAHAFEYASMGIAFVDTASRHFLKANAYVFDMLGYTEKELLLKTIDDIIHIDFKQSILKKFEKIRAGQYDGSSRKMLCLDKNLSEKRVRISISRIQSESNADTIVMVLFQELLYVQADTHAEQKTASYALSGSRADDHLAEQRANHTMHSMWAGMAHELRTPLNSIIGFSQVLRAKYFGELNAKQEEYIGDILESAEHLANLINDILDLAKIETGKLTLQRAPVSIANLLQQSTYMIKEKCMHHKISLEVAVDSKLEYLELNLDVRKMKQVMFTILSNAAEYTPDGGSIHLSGVLEKKHVKIRVQDSGIGMDKGQLSHVFKEFSQGDGQTSSGLGLPLSKKIIEMHGGQLWAESEGKGKGSLFFFTLPIHGADLNKKDNRDE